MKQFQKQFKKQADNIKLSVAVKRDIKERLVTYIEYHPLRETDLVTSGAHVLQSERFTMWRPSAFMVRNLVGTFVLLLVIGVPLAAERSMPGDVLYPVKVQFNEEVRSSLTRDSYNKVVWETERLERRIAEARLLAEEGKLTPEAEAQVAAAVKAHSDAAQEEIETLRTTDSDEAAIAEIAFNSALDVQSVVLRSDQDRASTTPTGQSDINAIAGTVDAERSESASRQTGQVVSIERLTARVEQETTRAFEYLETVKQFATDTELADIERRLSDIERKVARAYDEETSLAEATQALREILASTQKLIVFMTDIDVRENVSIEDLIPMERTDEERAAELEDMIDSITANTSLLEQYVDEAEESSVVEKVTEALAAGEAALAAATEVDGVYNYAVEVAVRKADELIADIVEALKLSEAKPVSTPEFGIEDPVGTSSEPAATSTDTTASSTSSATTTLGGAVRGTARSSSRATTSNTGGELTPEA